MATALSWVVGLALAVGSLAWWWLVVRSDAHVRERVARRYGVTIEVGSDGHWSVTSRERPWWSRLAIGLIQLAYYMGAMLVWCAAMLAGYMLLAYVHGDL